MRRPTRPAITVSRWRLFLKSSVLLCALSGSLASACTIPVFRYALDRWESDKFRLTLPAALAREPEMGKLLFPLRGNSPSNVKIEESDDVATTDARLFLPNKDETPIWSGKLDDAALKALLDSPARRALLAQLLAGESIVWVLVDHGTTEDDAEAARVEKRLKFLENVVELPPQDPNDPDSQLGPGPPLKLHFTVQRVSYSDNAEALLRPMLAGTKAAKALAEGKSFAAAVFGRGRVLGAWPLSELDDTALEDISIFLTGRCSCRVKNDNPGWDILMTVEWEKALQQAAHTAATPAPVPAQLTQPETVVTRPHAQPAPAATTPWRTVAAVSVPVILVAGWLVGRGTKR